MHRRKLVKIAVGSLHYSTKKTSTHNKWSLMVRLCPWEYVDVLVPVPQDVETQHVHLVWAQTTVLWGSDRSKPLWTLFMNQNLSWTLRWRQISEYLPEQTWLRRSAHVWCRFSKRPLWHLLALHHPLFYKLKLWNIKREGIKYVRPVVVIRLAPMTLLKMMTGKRLIHPALSLFGQRLGH